MLISCSYNACEYLPQVEQIELKKYAFGLFHGRDMMICSEDLACENKSSHHKLQNHKDHVLLNSSSKNTQVCIN
jgi:hypothetical protein